MHIGDMEVRYLDGGTFREKQIPRANAALGMTRVAENQEH